MPRTAEQVKAEAQAAKDSREAWRVQNERIRKAEQEREARIAKEREARIAAKKAAREAQAKERKAQGGDGTKRNPYVPGDGLTHATGKTRLGVERGEGCVCGCGEMPTKKRSRFIPGHDARMYRLAKMYKGELGPELQAAARETITDRQKAYLKGRNLI